MFYECEILNEQQLTHINDLFDTAEFTQGTVSQRDENNVDLSVKNNFVMGQHTSQFRKSLEVIQQGINDATAFRSTFVVKEMTVPQMTEYREGGKYNPHIDNITVQGLKAHHSITLFLNDPDEYEGGELVITDGDMPFKFKQKAGTALVYPTGYMHYVAPVTSGKRRVALMWATSLIEDFFMRHQILNFGKSIERLLEAYPDAPQEVLVPFEQVRTNFVREYGNL